MGSVSPPPTPLSPSQPRWDFAQPCSGGDDAGFSNSCERLLITVCVHGNEPCGMLAANELLEEGFLDVSIGGGPWPHARDRLTVLLGNPAGVEAGKRFIDSNLNRLFTPEEAQRAADGGGGGEHRRVPELAAAIEQSTQHVDIHSSSAPSPPFCFHFPGAEAAAFAASFPVAYAIEDTSIRGTTLHWAHQKGQPRSILVECGQHDARESVEVAKRCIKRLVTGQQQAAAPAAAAGQARSAAAAAEAPQAVATTTLQQAPSEAALQATEPEAPSQRCPKEAASADNLKPQALRTAGSVYIGRGFRWRQPVMAFQQVSQGDIIAEVLMQDDEQGPISCPHAQARIVMPTQLPVAGEEAWLWGVQQ